MYPRCLPRKSSVESLETLKYWASRDLNPDPCGLDPKSSASANSATRPGRIKIPQTWAFLVLRNAVRPKAFPLQRFLLQSVSTQPSPGSGTFPMDGLARGCQYTAELGKIGLRENASTFETSGPCDREHGRVFNCRAGSLRSREFTCIHNDRRRLRRDYRH